MYFLRALLLSLSFFVLAYSCAHLLLAYAFRLTARRRSLEGASANTLYLFQIAPTLIAFLTVFLFAIPSFVRFEPRAGEEELGFPIIVLSAVCVALFATGIFRAIRAIHATRRTTTRWFHEATPHVSSAGLPILQSGPNTPPLVVVGLLRPSLFVSSSASSLLSEDELRLAIAHESVHIQRRDNLKKLLLRLLNIPGNAVERAWLAAVEMDADRHAVRSKHEALSLASALVKTSKLTVPTAELAMNFSSEAGELLRLRVERLLKWEHTSQQARTRIWSIAALTLTAIACTIAVTYPVLLIAIHQFSEILVR